MACDAIVNNLGTGVFSGVREPCEAWSVDVQHTMSSDVYSPASTAKQALEWLEYAFQNAPALVEKNHDTRERLTELISSEMSLSQRCHLAFLAREIGAVGYEKVIVTPDNQPHMPHRTYRNEWWNLAGTIHDGRFMSLQVWRHSLVPKACWDTDDPEGVRQSVLRFAFQLGSEPVQYSSAFIESWGLALVDTAPRFRIQCGGMNSFESIFPESLFPAVLTWNGLTLTIDNTKPMFMLQSNGCVACSDGVGLKSYTYPRVEGDGFSGFLSHSWESSMMPRGFTSSLALRGIHHMEHSIGGFTPPRDSWMSVYVLLSNAVHVVMFFESPGVLTRVTASLDNGSTRVFRPAEFAVDHQQDPSGWRFRCRHADVTIEFKIPEPYGNSPESLTRLQQCPLINAQWLGAPAHGYCVVESPDMRGYDERAQEILRLFFGDRHASYFNAKYFSTTGSNSDVVASFVIWLLPLIFTVALLLFVAYLMVTRGRQYPWIRKRSLFYRSASFAGWDGGGGGSG